MKVVCAYARNEERRAPGLQNQTLAALEKCAHPVTMRNVAGDDEAYWRFLLEEWTADDDLVVIEHDVVPTTQVFEDFEWCPQPWCAFPYELAGGVMVALGCTRFRSDLIARSSDAIAKAGLIDDDGMPARHWVRLDTRIDRVLRADGWTPHVHQPAVRHLNDQQREVRYA